MRSDPFPFEAIRDLVGILRAIYAATPADHRVRRKAITATARELNEAAELAGRCEPGTLGFSAAWKRAEQATVRLTDLVEPIASVHPVLEAAGARVRGTRRVQAKPKDWRR